MTSPAVAPWNVAERPTVWVTWTGDLAAVLETARSHAAARVMLCGPRPTPGWLFGRQPHSWTGGAHYLDAALPVARFTHETGQAVQIRRAAEWFGEHTGNPATDLGPVEAKAAYELLARHYRRTIPDGRLFDSPGATGVDGWLRSGGSWAEQLSPDLADLIRATSPQHRVELFKHPGKAPGFVYLDGRWQYAALTRELGTAPAYELTAGMAAELADKTHLQTRARFRVRATVPKTWDTLGILMAPAGPSPTDGWRAPREPGEVFETWCDAAELRLAVACGWPVDYLEGIAYTGGRPLDTWTARLIRLRDAMLGAVREAGSPKIAAAAAHAVRAILLHGIGSFHSTGRDLVRVVNPMQYQGSAPLEQQGDVWTVRERQALTGRWATLAHPEFSSQVWARSHARLLESPTPSKGTWAGALQVPYADLIGVRGDALYLTRDPGWPDDGRPGRLRVKGTIDHPVPYPQIMNALNRLRVQAERTHP